MLTITVTFEQRTNRPLRIAMITHGQAVARSERQAHHIVQALLLGLLRKVAQDFKGAAVHYG